MTKRLALLFVLATIAVLLVPTLAFANWDLHGNYVKDTDECAGCHRAHTSVSSATWQDRTLTEKSALLVSSASEIWEFCFTCHDATGQGALTNVEEGVYQDVANKYGTNGGILNGGGFESFGVVGGQNTLPTTGKHIYTGAPWGAYGGGYTGKGTLNADGQYDSPTDPTDAQTGQSVQINMDCGTCHDPHGSANYRLLKSIVNGNYVGGYTPSSDPLNPDPDPWVWSNENGYPEGGFELHVEATGYTPNYTSPLYAKGFTLTAGSITGTDTAKGMSGWCVGCHSTYMTGETDRYGEGYVSESWRYNAGDGGGLKIRHKHPINVPMDHYKGTDAQYFKGSTQTSLPLAHEFTGNGSVSNSNQDWIECLTCHRAHGTAATMTGFATLAGSQSIITSIAPGGMGPHNVFVSKYEAALLRENNRAVCQICHNK